MAAVPVVVLSGELVEATKPMLRRLVEPHVSASNAGLILDVAGVTFASSAGLGWLVHLGKSLADQGRALALARVPRALERTLRVIGLDEVIPLYRHARDAEAWIVGRGGHEL